jgi:hypothetical protein
MGCEMGLTHALPPELFSFILICLSRLRNQEIETLDTD